MWNMRPGQQMLSELRVGRYILAVNQAMTAVPQRRWKHKGRWAAGDTKKRPTSLAMTAMDGIYGNGPYEKTWKSIRLALLSSQKYAAVVNNYSANRDTMDSFFRELGALPLNDYLQPVHETPVGKKEDSEINSTGKGEVAETLHERLREMSRRVTIRKREQTKVVEEVVEETEEEPSEFMPASPVVEEDIHARPEARPRQPRPSERAALIADITTLEIPKYLQAYVFPRGDISRFPAPNYDNTGFCDYYLLDAASLLPVLALGLQPDDRVLDLCAAPGGKSVSILQTMLPGEMYCNDAKQSRVTRLTAVLNSFFPMDSTEMESMVKITQRDALEWGNYEEPPFDKVLVDVPCTNDRVSANEEENNMFTSRRAGERSNLPQRQMDILMSACASAKKGGTVVYSTCSLSPLQNDGVVHMAMQELRQRHGIDMVAVDTSSFRHAFRIWEERFFPTDKGWGVFDIALDAEKRILLIAAFEKGLQRFRLDGQSAAILERSQIKEKHGHRGNVIKVSWHPLGKRFATCGTDSLTIIWKDDFTPEQQVRLAEIPQTLAWNPKVYILVTAAGPQLASISVPRDPAMYRLQSNIWCAAWNSIGEVYAVGLENGAVSVRDRRDNEMCLIHGTLNAPVWDVAWTPADAPRADVLVVLDWSCAIGFYQATGKQFRATCKLDFVPLRVSFSADWQLLYVCAADKKVYVVSIDGVVIGKIAECRSWPLRFLQRRTTNPYKSDFLVIGADGLINMLQITFDKCWHYHSGLYASRESLVNLTVKSLERNRETTIAVGEAIHKMALYRNLLAVVIPSSLVIYRQNTLEMMLRYEEVTRMGFEKECNVMLLAAQHVLLVHLAHIEAINFQGAVTQVWNFTKEIRCTKVSGGSPGQESLFVALIDGTIIRLSLDQPFIQTLLKIPSVPISFDVNLSHDKLAVVGENNVIYVYDLSTKEMLYQEAGADSCAWNQYHADMLAFSIGSLLKIKMGDNKVHTRRTETPLNGKVLGYAGSKVFYETAEAKAVVVDVPHTILIHQCMERKEFADAYTVACFGCSDNDWKVLGNKALENFDVDTAKQCFRRVRDYPMLSLMDHIEQRRKVGDGNENLHLGDIMAFRGQFDDAGRAYSAGGRSDLAVKMLTDMRRFKQAEQWATDEEQKRGLLELRAGWAQQEEDKGEAIELFLQLGEVEKALLAMKEVGWARRILDTARLLDVTTQRPTIEQAARILLEMGDTDGAAELYELIKDIKSVVDIKLSSQDWEYLLALSDREPFHRETILLPYAQHLIEHDRFIEARSVYLRAGHPQAATSVLGQLSQVAVTIGRFSDASFYNHLLGEVAEESTLALTDPVQTEQAYKTADEFYSLAELYNLYSVVDNVVKDPFSALSAESVFHASRILAAKLWNVKDVPTGIRLGYVLFVVANYGMKLECYKTARMAMERLKELRLPRQLYGRFVELYVQNRTCPFQDPQELADFCHACSSFNSLLNTKSGFSCQSCASSLKYCNVSFEHLPLVEFFLAPTITHDEALTLIAIEPALNTGENASGVDVQEGVVRFDRPKTAAPSGSNEQFFADFQRKGAIVVDREVLRNLNEEEVVVLRRGNGRQWRFFRNMLADVVPVTACNACWRLFNSDDYFASILQLRACPFCREPVTSETTM